MRLAAHAALVTQIAAATLRFGLGDRVDHSRQAFACWAQLPARSRDLSGITRRRALSNLMPLSSSARSPQSRVITGRHLAEVRSEI
jgi:hypothetical protein